MIYKGYKIQVRSELGNMWFSRYCLVGTGAWFTTGGPFYNKRGAIRAAKKAIKRRVAHEAHKAKFGEWQDV